MSAAESRCLMAAIADCSKPINMVVMSASINRAEDPNVSLIRSLASVKAFLATSTYRDGPSSPAYQAMWDCSSFSPGLTNSRNGL